MIMEGLNVCEGCAVMSPEVRRREIPFVAAWLAMGAAVVRDYKGCKDTVGVSVNADKEQIELSLVDFEVADGVADKLRSMVEKHPVVSADQVMMLCRQAARILDAVGDTRRGKRGVVMLKDRS